MRSHSESRLREEDDRRKRWFRPRISKRSVEIVSQDRGHESPSNLFDRMARASYDSSRRRKAMEERIYGQLSFTPDIDPLSRALGTSSGLEELVSNPRGRRARREAELRATEEVSSQCTFTPTVSPYKGSRLQSQWRGGSTDDECVHYSSDWGCGCPLQSLEEAQLGVKACASDPQKLRSVSINLREPERMARDIRLHLQQKEELRQRELDARDIELLKDCTFQPKAARPPATNLEEVRDTVPVRGMERHLELRDLANRRQQEHEQRLEQLFGLKGGKTLGLTMVEVTDFVILILSIISHH